MTGEPHIDIEPVDGRGLRSADHRQGAPHATLVLIEYGDFQCPTCKQAAETVDLLQDAFGSSLLFVFRHYPLEQIHPQALLAAEAAESAGAQGRFWEMHSMLFANQLQLHPQDLERYGQRIELDMERFRHDLRTHVHLPRVRADMEMGRQARVRSTPGFFLNGKVQDVSFGMRGLHDAVLAAFPDRSS